MRGSIMGNMESSPLVGALVQLRRTEVDDKAALVAIRSTETVRRWWQGDDLEVEFDADLAEEETVRYTITEFDGKIVGLIQYHEEDDPQYFSASIDIYLDPAVHRQGYASDAIRTLAEHLFDERGHHRLTIDPSADNAAAIACYAGVGFQPVGVMRQYERRADGTWGDGLLMEWLTSDRADR